ncbi:condensation domain-containing protein [Streptomyces sp. NBC_01190]|uniref:condensation domain-containing protein n=1 Tax=Streptomyces sp. NBC_01190 TaxID=2903767 RepID=UPI0038643136|nr:condensation domain-containing protein [Streptomyces sp. NBC_01190]
MFVDAPLTFGQLSTWRSIETFAADRLMEVNVPALWDVDGLDAAAIDRALRTLVRRHESLRTTFHTGADGRPFQRVHPDIPVRVDRLDLPSVAPADGARVLRELYARPFPVVGDPGWHGTLVCAAGRPRYLAVSMSHMVVDVWAIRALEEQLRQIAAGPATDGATAPGPAPRELAGLQHGDAWAAHRRGAAKYWQKILAGGPLSNLPALPPRPDERRIQATLRSHRLAGLVARAAAAHRVSPQSVLTALTGAALSGVLSRGRIMLSLMCANRFDPLWQPVISTMNQLVPLVCAVDPDTPLSAFLKRAHLNSLLAYRHGSYDVDAAARLATDAPGPDGSLFVHDCWFNYVTEPANPAAVLPESPLGTPPDASLTWVPPARNAGHPCYVRVNGDGGTWVEVTVRTDPELLGEEEVASMLRTVALGALRAATAPDATVGALLDDALADGAPAKELGAELFPRRPALAQR